jgi:hypothetical protein
MSSAAVLTALLGLGIGFATSGQIPHDTRTHEGATISRTAQGPASTIKARLLDALNSASSDIVVTNGVLADGQTAERWANADNTRSVEVISGEGEWPDSENLTTWDDAIGMTSLTIYPATKTWTETVQGGPDGPRPTAPASIREQLNDGVYNVVGSGEVVDGHDTIELSSTGDDHLTSDLWVDSTNYLPVRESSSDGTGVPINSVDWTYLAPSPAALRSLQLVVPAGYTKVMAPPTATTTTTGNSPSDLGSGEDSNDT